VTEVINIMNLPRMHSSRLLEHFHILHLVHVRSHVNLSCVHYDQHPSSHFLGGADEEGYPRFG
jgi:hypothetical protein